MFDSYVTFQARLRPHALAIMTPDRWASYGELEADVTRLAGGLRARGVTREIGVVSLQLTDEYLRHVGLLALARLRVASSPSHDPDPDVRLVEEEGADAPGFVRLNRAWLAATFGSAPVPVAAAGGAMDDAGRVMLSSGTTSRPRRMAHSWATIDSNTRSAAVSYLAGKAGRWVTLIRQDAMLGQSMCLAAWATGAAVIVGFTPRVLADQLGAIQPQVIGGAPAQLRELLSALPPGHAVLPGLRLVVAGAAMSRPVALEARLRLSSDILISYGATECGCSLVGDATQLETHPALAGAPVPGSRVEVVDSDGQPLPDGEVGELLIRCDRVVAGYIGDPEASARAFRNGAFYPGDLAHRLPDGQIALDGRTDERMTVGLHKFMPGLMEEVALDCLGVVDAAAFAAPDEDGIDRCWLAVVQGEGFNRTHLADLLAGGGAFPPVRFAFTESIPRGPMGKVERDRLRRETMAALGVQT